MGERWLWKELVVKGCLVWGPEEDFRNISPRAVEAIGLLGCFLFCFKQIKVT